MNNNSSDGCGNLIRRAREKIERDSKFKHNCCIAITGPTGPTDTYDYFFNKINRNYSSSKRYISHKTL